MLEKAIFKETTNKFIVRVASKPEENKALLEVGVEYVADMDEAKIFRKRK